MGRNIPLLSFHSAKLKTQSFIPHFLSQFSFPSSGFCLFLDVPSALYKSTQESHMFPGCASPDATSRRTLQGILPFPAVVEPQHLSIIVRFSKTLLSYFQLISLLLRAKKHLHDLVVYYYFILSIFHFSCCQGQSFSELPRPLSFLSLYRFCSCTGFLLWLQTKMFR